MSDMMTLPDTWEEFEKSYGFTDNEEVYTNGARLIPSFRVKQWLDHLSSEEPQKWIPVSERLPEPRIDVWCNSDLGQTVGYYDETCDMWFKNDYTELIVTAWMPLPEPWKEDEE